MRKLTLDQAAEELGIKKESVYKRTQRHTLPYTIEPDGQMYVYLDRNEGAREDASAPNTGDGNGGNNRKWWQTDRSWWDLIAAASGIAVLLGALIYVLGLVVLMVPLWRVQTHNLGTAWHATFLVPRAVVAGLGVRQLVAFPLIAAALIYAWLFFYGFVERTTVGKLLAIFLRYGVVLLLIVYYCAWHLATVSTVLTKASLDEVRDFLAAAVGALVLIGLAAWLLREREYAWAAGFALGFIVLALSARAGWRSDIAPLLGTQRIDAIIDITSVVCAALIVYFGAGFAEEIASYLGLRNGALSFLGVMVSSAIIGAFLLTIPSTPPLPKVEVDVAHKDNDAVGTLLTHTDSFWYVFEEQKGQPSTKLTAIPDDEVKTAWVSRDPE